MAYRIAFARKAEKALMGLPIQTKKNIARQLDKLSLNPHPPGSRKLQGEDDLYRIRAGDWRIIYTVIEESCVILVVKIGHRRDIYERL